MGEKRKGHADGAQGHAKKRRFIAAAHKMQARGGEIRGPGLWITCDRRKEGRAVTEAYDILNEAADKLYPRKDSTADGDHTNTSDGDDVEESIEDQIARELELIQSKDGKENTMRFQSVKTDTECLIWISCLPPCNPIQLTTHIVNELQNGGPARTKHLQRITPVSATCQATPEALRLMAYRILQATFAPLDYTEEQRAEDEFITYRIEPFLRNHSGSLSRDIILHTIGSVVRDLTTASFQYPEKMSEIATITNADGGPKSASGDADKQDSPKHENVAESEGVTNGNLDASIGATEGGNASETKITSLEGRNVAEEGKVLGGDASADAVLDENPSTSSMSGRPRLPEARRKTKVDLKHPKYTILVSALKGVCGLSIVEGFEESRRFNIQVLSEKKVQQKPPTAAQAETPIEA